MGIINTKIGIVRIDDTDDTIDFSNVMPLTRRLRRGHTVSFNSDVLVYIESGCIIAFDSNNTMIGYFSKGAMLLNPSTIRGRDESTLRVSTYGRCCDNCNRWNVDFFSFVLRKLKKTQAQVIEKYDVSFKLRREQIAWSLIHLAENNLYHTDNPNGLTIKTSLIEIASMFNASRERTGKLVNEMNDEGVLKSRGKNFLLYFS